MLTQICAEIKNYFCQQDDIVIDDFAIINGEIFPPVNLESGQYFRIVGSIFNDGVHAYTDMLIDEPKFHGAVWKMRVPADVIQLDAEIEAWQAKNATIDSQAMSPFASESFGGYSYSKGSGVGRGSGTCWQDVFATRLDMYRKMRVL